jgi:hypothetical protein
MSEENESEILIPVGDEKKKKKSNSPAVDGEPSRTVYIKEFDMQSMPPFDVPDKDGIKIVVIGKPGTGKSTIIADILASKSHIVPVAQIFSGTEDSNHFFSEKFPGVCVFNKLDLEAIESFITRQKIAKQYLPNPWAFQIIDDCTDDPKILKRPIFQSYYKLGRHWKMIHILSLQYCLDIQPNIRTNIDYTFILCEKSKRFRKSLWENYASCIDSFDDFCDIMDAVTGDYTALVINNKIQSNKFEDCVFWYKAKKDRLPPNWKFGHPSAWAFHHTRFDPNYIDPIS